MRRAILGFSYGYRKEDPGESNRRLVQALYQRHSHLIHLYFILQHELAACLPENSRDTTHVIKEHKLVPNAYLDTEEVARQGIEFALKNGIEKIYLLAHPLHRTFAWRVAAGMATPHDIEDETLKTGWIPADPLSEQWWTRNHLFIIPYAAGRIFGRKGK